MLSAFSHIGEVIDLELKSLLGSLQIGSLQTLDVPDKKLVGTQGPAGASRVHGAALREGRVTRSATHVTVEAQ